MASRSNRWKKGLLVVLTAALAVTGPGTAGAAWARDHRRGDRQRIEHRAAERHVVDHRHWSTGNRAAERHVVDHRHRSTGHRATERHVVDHRHWSTGHRATERHVVDHRHRSTGHRATERHVVDHRHWSTGHHVRHPYRGRSHPVVRDRVVIHHRHRPIGHHLWWRPHWEAAFVIGGLSYFYWEGAFYRPWGIGYVAVAAPIGAFVPLLPPGCSVVYVAGTRYYYGDHAYYLWDGDRAGYVVVPPPAGAAEVPPASAAPTVFIYPKAGQSAELQEQDRRECEDWATSQSGFDPRDEDAETVGRDDYVRAMSACLEGRDYTVK